MNETSKFDDIYSAGGGYFTDGIRLFARSDTSYRHIEIQAFVSLETKIEIVFADR